MSWGGRPACHPPLRWLGFVAAPFGKGWHTPGGSCPSRGHFVSSRRQKVCGACSLCGVGRRVARALSEPSTQISLDLVIHEVGVFDRICAVSLLCPQGLHQLLPCTCVPPPPPLAGDHPPPLCCAGRPCLSQPSCLPVDPSLFLSCPKGPSLKLSSFARRACSVWGHCADHTLSEGPGGVTCWGADDGSLPCSRKKSYRKWIEGLVPLITACCVIGVLDTRGMN